MGQAFTEQSKKGGKRLNDRTVLFQALSAPALPDIPLLGSILELHGKLRDCSHKRSCLVTFSASVQLIPGRRDLKTEQKRSSQS